MKESIIFDGTPYILSMKKIRRDNPFFHPDTIEIVFPYDGDIDLDIEGDISHLKKGDFMIVNAGLTHSIKAKDDVLVASLYIDLNFYEKKNYHIHGQGFFCHYIQGKQYDTDIYKVIRNYLIRLAVMECLDIPRVSEVGKEISDLIMDILIYHIHDDVYLKKSASELKDIERERLFEIAYYIYVHHREQGLSLNDIAAKVNLSTTRLGHFWKQVTSISITDSINMHRFFTSKRTLMSTDLPITEISRQSGYSDEKYMYKAFKEKYRLTPKEYRETHLKIHEREEIYEEIDVRTIRNELIKYADTYYYCIKDFTYLKGKEEKIDEEKRLNFMYDIISTIEKNPQIENDENYKNSMVYLGSDGGLKKTGNEISINWEYIYAIVQLSLAQAGKCIITIDISFIRFEEWVNVLKKIISEVKENTGNDFSLNTSILIRHSGLPESNDALKLADILKKEKLFWKATPMLAFKTR